jgi:hypothetical protein
MKQVPHFRPPYSSQSIVFSRRTVTIFVLIFHFTRIIQWLIQEYSQQP